MSYEKAPSSGAFLPLSLMHFLSGEPMHDLSGVDTRAARSARSNRSRQGRRRASANMVCGRRPSRSAVPSRACAAPAPARPAAQVQPSHRDAGFLRRFVVRTFVVCAWLLLLAISNPFIPATAGTQGKQNWIPANAGMNGPVGCARVQMGIWHRFSFSRARDCGRPGFWEVPRFGVRVPPAVAGAGSALVD